MRQAILTKQVERCFRIYCRVPGKTAEFWGFIWMNDAYLKLYCTRIKRKNEYQHNDNKNIFYIEVKS